MTHATTPALHADDRIATLEYTKVDAVADAPLQAAIDIFLPGLLAKVWFWFAKEEWVDAAIEMGVLRMIVSKLARMLTSTTTW